MEIDGFDSKDSGKDSRELGPEFDDPRSMKQTAEGDDDDDFSGADSDGTDAFAHSGASPHIPVNTIAELSALVVAQFAVLAGDIDRKHEHLARKVIMDLKAMRQEMSKLTIPEARDEGIRDHMRVMQGQVTNMHYESMLKIEALKDIGGTEFRAASKALSSAARDLAAVARRAIYVCIGTVVLLQVLLILMIVL